MQAVTLINSFKVPVGREEHFFSLWQQVNTYMKTKPGYLGHKLHRALSPEAPHRFVNVAQWSSLEQFQAAHDDGFRALVAQPGWEEFPAFPNLFEVIHEDRSAFVAA